MDRTARGVRLTPAGELLVEHAHALLGRLAAEHCFTCDALVTRELRGGAPAGA